MKDRTKSVRRALILSSAERNWALLMSFATTLVTARLLTPADFGVAIIGLAVFGLTDIFREFGGNSYIIQVDKITAERVQTVFTVTAFLALPLFVLMFVFAGDIASFYRTPGLKYYLRVTAVCLLLAPFCSPIVALLSRELSWEKLTVLSLGTTALNSVLTISLALLGFSFMSYAWAQLATSVVFLALCIVWGPKFPIYGFSLKGWRDVAHYGVFDSARGLLLHLGDAAPSLAFGKIMGPEGLGLYQRALMISRLPERTVIAGFTSVAQPAFSQRAREGHDLSFSFLMGIEYVTVLLWPSLILIVLLAHPLVAILLGGQWTAAVPLVQIIAASYLIWFPMSLPRPTLLAAGAVRDTATLALLTVPISVVIQISASIDGPEAVAWSFFLSNTICVLASVIMVRRRVPFAWSQLANALKKSAFVTVASAVGPILIVILSGGTDKVSIAGGIAGGIAAGFGWLIGISTSRHPARDEIKRAIAAISALALFTRFLGMLKSAKDAAMALGSGLSASPPVAVRRSADEIREERH